MLFVVVVLFYYLSSAFSLSLFDFERKKEFKSSFSFSFFVLLLPPPSSVLHFFHFFCGKVPKLDVLLVLEPLTTRRFFKSVYSFGTLPFFFGGFETPQHSKVSFTLLIKETFCDSFCVRVQSIARCALSIRRAREGRRRRRGRGDGARRDVCAERRDDDFFR